MNQSISLVIVVGYRLFGECLASTLGELKQFEVLGLASNVEEALREMRKMQKHRPNVMLIDDNLPCPMALKLTYQLTRDFPDVKVLILGLNELEADIQRYVEAGASGYVVKKSSHDDLKRAVDMIIHGETSCSPRIAYSMFLRLAELARKANRSKINGSENLTKREIEILQLISEGQSNKQIANQLFLSLYTVKNHVHNILEKLQVKRRSEATEYAYERRWVID